MDWEVKYYPEYWYGKKLAYPHVPKESGKFAKSMAVGNLLFVSGCTGKDTTTDKPISEKFEDQMIMALDKVKMAMEEAGSSMENVVKTVMLVKNLDDYPKMRKTEVEYYLRHAPYLVENPPASTFIVPASLAKPGYLIEIDVMGVINRKAPDWNVKYYAESWGGKKLTYPQVPKEHPKFARTEVVGNLVIISGCEALNHDTVKVETNDFKEQTKIVLEKLRVGMEETGGSMDNLLKTYVLLKDLKDYPQYREGEQEFFRKHAPGLAKNPPASTVINVSSLARPEFLVSGFHGVAPLVVVYYMWLRLLLPEADLLVNQTLHYAFGLLVLLCLGLGLAALFHSYWKATSAERSQGLGVLLLGSLIGIIPPAAGLLTYTFLPKTVLPGSEYYSLLVLLTSLSLARALWRSTIEERPGGVTPAA